MAHKLWVDRRLWISHGNVTTHTPLLYSDFLLLRRDIRDYQHIHGPGTRVPEAFQRLPQFRSVKRGIIRFEKRKEDGVVFKIFKAAGMEAPSADAINTSHFNSLIGEEVKINIGKNQQGYDTIKRFYPKASRATVAVGVDEGIPDEISEQTADPDLDEDVPF